MYIYAAFIYNVIRWPFQLVARYIYNNFRNPGAGSRAAVSNQVKSNK